MKITRGTVCIRMIYWIAPISLRRRVEPGERRVTTSFDRVKGIFRVAKWARGHGSGFGQSDTGVETKEITISYLGQELWIAVDYWFRFEANCDLLSLLELIHPLDKQPWNGDVVDLLINSLVFDTQVWIRLQCPVQLWMNMWTCIAMSQHMSPWTPTLNALDKTQCSRSYPSDRHLPWKDTQKWGQRKKQKERNGRPTLQEYFPGILGMTFVRTIRAFKSITLAQAFQRFLCNDMSTRHHHRRILIGCLLLWHGTDKDRMEEILRRKGYFDLTIQILA